MNRIVLIGNGFDLAHNLKTSYEDFIDWYWDDRVDSFISTRNKVSEDILCKLTMLSDYTWSTFKYIYLNTLQQYKGRDIIQAIREKEDDFKVEDSPLFRRINHSVDTKKWVDIEEEYYQLLTLYSSAESGASALIQLNQQLKFLKDKLVEYLTAVSNNKVAKNAYISSRIYEPIKIEDIAIGAIEPLKQYLKLCVEQDEKWINDITRRYGYAYQISPEDHAKLKVSYEKQNYVFKIEVPLSYMLPHSVLLLNFNYTHTANLYHNSNLGPIINIHGSIEEPNGVIFGYGDELDDRYKKIKEISDNECRRNIKSIKYLESDNYRSVLRFMESAPYQISIMGHSCGNSDRTLLNALFEHKNCISIKPFYYKKKDGTDNYLELAQNISRIFTDMKLMRDRVVNKTFCETITN